MSKPNDWLLSDDWLPLDPLCTKRDQGRRERPVREIPGTNHIATWNGRRWVVSEKREEP